jgi:hypothetical protein
MAIQGFCHRPRHTTFVWLLGLCTALLLNEIHLPMKFQVDTSNTFEISSGQKSMEKNKGQWLKNYIAKSYHSCAQRSPSIRSIHLWHIMLTSQTLFEVCSTQVKNQVWKITKSNNSKNTKGRVFILVHCTPPE